MGKVYRGSCEDFDTDLVILSGPMLNSVNIGIGPTTNYLISLNGKDTGSVPVTLTDDVQAVPIDKTSNGMPYVKYGTVENTSGPLFDLGVKTLSLFGPLSGAASHADARRSHRQRISAGMVSGWAPLACSAGPRTQRERGEDCLMRTWVCRSSFRAVRVLSASRASLPPHRSVSQ